MQCAASGTRIHTLALVIVLVELHLTKVFGRDLSDLQIDQEEATRKEVVENEIAMLDLVADVNRALLADQCKAAPQLQQCTRGQTLCT